MPSRIGASSSRISSTSYRSSWNMNAESTETPEPSSREQVLDENGLITGFVARVLNSRELVINRGSEHGVELDMHFEVLAPEGEDITDPETGEPLGSIE